MTSVLVPCPHCGIKISSDSQICLYCKREITNGLDKDASSNLERSQRTSLSRLNIVWGTLGTLAAFLLIPLGSVLLLLPLEAGRLGADSAGRVTLAFSLVGCVFGLLLAPAAGILGGCLGDRLGRSTLTGAVGAILGGSLYAVLVLLFGLLNLMLAGQA